ASLLLLAAFLVTAFLVAATPGALALPSLHGSLHGNSLHSNLNRNRRRSRRRRCQESRPCPQHHDRSCQPERPSQRRPRPLHSGDPEPNGAAARTARPSAPPSHTDTAPMTETPEDHRQGGDERRT